MCGRYVLTQDHARALLAQLGVRQAADAPALPASRYNLPPGGPVLAVLPAAAKPNRLGDALSGPTGASLPPGTPRAPAPRLQAQNNTIGWFGSPAGAAFTGPAGSADAGQRELAWLRWGLTPVWAAADTRPVTNARAESLAAKPTFREAYRSRRCLVLASAFYEWQVVGRTRRPWLFRRPEGQPFAFAGLWETYRASDGQSIASCALITTAANALMQPVHHRMPAILVEAEAWKTWLDPRISSTDTLDALLQPLPCEALTATPVNPRVNQIRHDDPSCLDPAGAHPGADGEPQLALGL